VASQIKPGGQHVLPHITWPVGQGAVQTPLTHVWPEGQQTLPHMGVPSGQGPVHFPFSQVIPAGQQTLPQMTLLAHPHAPVVARQVKPGGQHTGPQGVWSWGQRVIHIPLTQAVPGKQTVPHVPQLALSLVKSTQVEPHIVLPVGQPHLPSTHA